MHIALKRGQYFCKWQKKKESIPRQIKISLYSHVCLQIVTSACLNESCRERFDQEHLSALLKLRS